ncbi:MAG TPA: acetyl-CoA carboxylase biotin carboxyl carrier protein [Elusimicrobiota bacterium]|nr:acetyl-CoA carboxylase biotin carboxyl carrier protein [Elusimicrobiota bacterium]
MTDSDKMQKKKDIQELRSLFDLMVSENLSELEIGQKNFSVKLVRRRAVRELAPTLPVPDPVLPEGTESAVAEPEPQGVSIASPLAGVFYRAPSPQSDPFVREGDKVSYGQVLCIVEAMKVMNEIRADRACVVKKILAENGKPVSADQKLFLVEPAD